MPTKTAYLAAVDATDVSGKSLINGGQYTSTSFSPSFLSSKSAKLPILIFDPTVTQISKYALLNSAILHGEAATSITDSGITATVSYALGTLNVGSLDLTNGVFSDVTNQTKYHSGSIAKNINKKTFTVYDSSNLDSLTPDILSSSDVYIVITVNAGSDTSSNSYNIYVKNVYLTLDWTDPTFTINVSAGAGGTVTGSESGIDVGSTRTITATPSDGYKFVKWSDGDTNATRTISLTEDMLNDNVTVLSYTAEFELDKTNNIYIGTFQPSAIYLGTSEVKEVYVGTTKVYG